MRLSQVPSSSRPHTLPLGEMRFVSSVQVPEVCADLATRKFLVVGAAVGPLAPMGLRRRIDDAVEGELATRGALPAAIGVDAELSSCIRDQVFRARALGTTGIAIALPPLSELTDPEGHLNVDDSAALLAWTRATAELPVVLLASEADRTVSAYAPMPLERLLASEGRAAPPAPPPAVDEATWLEASREPASDPFDMTPPPAAVSARDTGRTPAPPAVGPRVRTTPVPPAVAVRGAIESRPAIEPRPAVQSRPAIESFDADITAPDALPVHTDTAAPDAPPAPRLKPGILQGKKPHAATSAARPQLAPRAQADSYPDADPRAETFARSPSALDADLDDAPEIAPPDPRFHSAPRDPYPAGETATITARARETNAARVVNSAEWRNIALELDAARGPKPVRVIEQLFMTRYVPLVGALARGEADGAVRSIVDSWSQSFEHSYVDAFSAMRVTGKRPPMTFDSPEIAGRLGRLNGARTVKLLLVDSMSFDLGERVTAEMRARSTGAGVVVERMLLWSALPTTTPMQLSLLAKGGDGLRDAEPPSEPETEISRGRAVTTLRRERLGTREVMKLDLVESRLRAAGPSYEERLDSIADEVAGVLSRYLESLPPRTLLFVFGDHGFKLPKSPDSRTTGPALQGGASPEEVLVPGYAWLSGGVH